MSETVIEKVERHVLSIVDSMGFELVDMEFKNEGQGWVLRIFIDVEGGITHDHCSLVSREVGQYFDVEDVIEQAYYLEVSSPGIERPLKTLEAFDRFVGKKCRLKLHEAKDGGKTFEGIIEPLDGEVISLSLDGKVIVKCRFEELNKARLAL